VQIYVSSLYDKIESSFDNILSNPPIRAGKEVVFGIVEEGFHHLLKGGSIRLVIQKKQGAPSLIKKMEEIYSNVKVVNKENGYYILESIKI
jgi:16S rRNA (guanine1207-N2)-methyltransferase